MASDAGTVHVAVPCNGCRLCCFQHVYLYPEDGDDPDQFECEMTVNPLDGRIQHRLKLKPGTDDECWYLGPNGCTIYERAPAMCKKFDCRAFYKKMVELYPRKLRRKLVATKRLHGPIMEAGKARL